MKSTMMSRHSTMHQKRVSRSSTVKAAILLLLALCGWPSPASAQGRSARPVPRVGVVVKTLLTLFLAFGWQTTASLQTYTLAPSPHLFALDASGNIINAGCIWTYLTGTSTAATTYRDRKS